MHLDPVARHAVVWSIDPILGLVDRFADRWPGWTLEFQQDRYLQQQRRCAEAFLFPDPASAADAHTYDFAWHAVKTWIPATAEYSDVQPRMIGGRDWLHGMPDAGLTIADLQRLGDLVLGPDRATGAARVVAFDRTGSRTATERISHRRRPLDVAAYAGLEYGQ
jgi:hypothetical protein